MPRKNKKKNKKVTRPIFTNISVVNSTYTYCEDTRGEDGPYSGFCDTSHDNNVNGIKIIGPNEYGDLKAPFKVEAGKSYYLLYAIYSDGDSFSRETGIIDYIDLYENKEDALKNSKRISEHHLKYNEQKLKPDDQYNVSLTNSAGKEYRLHTAWNGYFSDLTNVEVKEVYANVQK